MKLNMQIALRLKQYLGEITQNNNDGVYMDFSIQVMKPDPGFDHIEKPGYSYPCMHDKY